MSLIEDLGLDPDSLTWEDLAACQGMETSWFFEDYENSSTHAKQVDQVCLNCPVIMACSKAGRSNKEEGVWGGVYWANGKIDKTKNKHKTEAEWKAIEKRVGAKIR